MPLQQILVPDIGASSDVAVIEVLVKENDKIEKNQSLVTLESDKASMEVPAPFAGVIKSVKVKIGDKVSEGALLFEAETESVAVTKTPEKPVEKTISSEPIEKLVEVKVPDIGGAKDVAVIEVMIKAGDTLKKDQSIMTLESDKASMEIPSPYAGIVKEVLVKVGDKISEGTVVLKMMTSEVALSQPEQETKSVAEAISTPAPASTKPSMPSTTIISSADVHAGPAVRRLAYELGVDLKQVKGTGRKERVQLTDIHAYVKNALREKSSGGLAIPQAPQIDFTKFGEVETKALSKIKKLTGVNTHRSWVTIPHVTQFDEADITDLEEFRLSHKEEAEKKGFKLTPLVFLMKSVVACLKQFPIFNSSLDASGENIIMKKYFHIGVAMDTPNGLVVGAQIEGTLFNDLLFDTTGTVNESFTRVTTSGFVPTTSTTAITENETVNYENRLRSMFDFVARAGVLVRPNALIYGLAGLAEGHFQLDEAEFDFPNVNLAPGVIQGILSGTSLASNEVNKWEPGYILGVGGEYRINGHWSLRGEYRYTRFSFDTTQSAAASATTSTSTSTTSTSASFAQNTHTNLTYNEGLIGVVFRFA